MNRLSQRRSLTPWGAAICAIFFTCLLVATPCLAQTPASGASVYRISKGDVLRVDVIGRPDISGRFTVESNGAVTLPLVGSIPVAGKTPNDVAGELSGRFALVDRDILRVNVAVSESQNQRVYVLGAVLKPGSYSFLAPTNAWDAIVEAGGATDDANLSAVEIVPGDAQSDRSIKTIDIDTALRQGNLASLENVRPGDAIRVPRVFGSMGGGNLVYIFGAVATQGAQPISMAPDVVSAVIRSGGAAPDANLSKVEVARKNGDRVSRFRINMRSYTKDANASGNLALQPGDTIYVPRSSNRASVFGIIGVLGPIIAIATSVAALTRR